jgi:hypothetical protein
VRGISDLKNEVKIIISPDETFELWKEFLEKHSTGGLINLDTLAKFNQEKNFKVTKNFTLACEFFKHLGHFIDEDLKVFVQHLLGKTPDRTCSYPKVTVHKTSKLHRTHYSAAEWVEHRKKKLVVLQELDELDGSLEFIIAEGTVDSEMWRTWKQLHNVSTASWNVLLYHNPATYFAKRLTNERKLKRACEFQEKFPEVLHFLQKILRLKTRFQVSGGSAKFRVLNSESMEFGAPWAYSSNKQMSLALMDLHDTLGHSVVDDYTKQTHFGLLLAMLRGLRNPSISTPAIWIWIVNSANQLAQAREYATQTLRNYTIVEAKYIPAKNERLYDLTIRKKSPDVFLMFLVKTGDVEAEGLKAKIRSEYHAPDIPYYTDSGKYSELKYRLSSSELRMEFYLDLLHNLCRPGDSFLGVYSGSKCLVAAKVSCDSILSLLRYTDVLRVFHLSSSRG